MPRRCCRCPPRRLSHIGSRPIPLPASVHITLSDVTAAPAPLTRLGRTDPVTVAGPLGRQILHLHKFVRLTIAPAADATTTSDPNQLAVQVRDPAIKHQRALWGTSRALLARAVHGVSTGFTLSVQLVGVGYRAVLIPSATPSSPSMLSMKLGYCHTIDVPIPSDLTVTVDANGARFVVSGVDWQRVTQFAAQVRKWRPPEPYNGKGVFVGNETVRRKVGKKK